MPRAPCRVTGGAIYPGVAVITLRLAERFVAAYVKSRHRRGGGWPARLRSFEDCGVDGAGGLQLVVAVHELAVWQRVGERQAQAARKV